MSVARKILDNQRLTDAERTELRRNLEAIIAEMRAIFMSERSRTQDVAAPYIEDEHVDIALGVYEEAP